MSGIYTPEAFFGADTRSPSEMAEWVESELQRVAEVMAEELSVRDLFPLSAAPAKYQEGSLVNFDINALNNVPGLTEAGLHVFRNGAWRRLVEA